MARRGFFAELQHQAKVAAREQARAEREAEKAWKAAARRAEQARKADERAAKQLARANDAERKRLEKKAKEAHIANMEANTESRNLQLAGIYEEIDSLLEATLGVDDYVDLEGLRTAADHPPFDRPDIETPIPLPAPVLDPPEPKLQLPSPPTGFKRIFGRGAHARATADAYAELESATEAWRNQIELCRHLRDSAAKDHAERESKRQESLANERERYARECETREVQASEHNAAIDKLVSDLGYGAADAVQEYVSIVLSNSVYPDHFPIRHEFEFEPETAELKLRVLVPGPDKLTSVKAYKYTKASDEITHSSLSQKACRDRYAEAVNQIALRSLHEIFEADRRGIIKTIALEVGTETIDPATGLDACIPFVATGAERESFLQFNLSSVVPAATLTHLGASVSKNPYELVAADLKGIRRS